MMRLILIATLLISLGISTDAQDVYEFDRDRIPVMKDQKTKKYMFTSLTLNRWLDEPNNMIQRTYSPGFDFSLLWSTKNMEKEHGNFSFHFAMGVGFSSFNLHNNGEFYNEIDAQTDEMTLKFRPYPDGYSYSRNNISMNYLEVPIEFVIEEKRSMPSIHIGAKFGYLLGMHSRLKDGTGKYKRYIFANTEWYRYGAYIRLFFKNIGIGAFYGMNSGLGDFPDMRPLSISITLKIDNE